ncbi:unnamed protein product [Rotaria sp. Silwood2]|nr:unnamed protein product [Rotaria sp. Silwood2]CAF2923261.1 unnamed protein product [Rotaria sp. Silwood2]CAF3141648.1 unnamed protein product [Rotaria sp. Silwood2]CAF3295004.1 unnamed protein product [Rotaria sp. Silwood2]CAF4129834.1 unnamed protein product [Rotaria sp. Silwood2]
MTSEQVTVGQAIQKLSEANNSNNARLADLENKLAEIHLNIVEQHKNATDNLSNKIINLQETMTNQIESIQTWVYERQDTTISKLQEQQQQWNNLTNNVRNMQAGIKKICGALAMNQTITNYNNQVIENKSVTSHINQNSSTIKRII